MQRLCATWPDVIFTDEDLDGFIVILAEVRAHAAQTAVTAAQAWYECSGPALRPLAEARRSSGSYVGNIDAEPGERDRGRSVIGGEQAEYDMLGADEVVAEGESLPQRLLQRLLRDK